MGEILTDLGLGPRPPPRDRAAMPVEKPSLVAYFSRQPTRLGASAALCCAMLRALEIPMLSWPSACGFLWWVGLGTGGSAPAENVTRGATINVHGLRRPAIVAGLPGRGHPDAK